MSRMRWMRSEKSGRDVLLCLYCEAEVEARDDRVLYCFCRTSGKSGDIAGNLLQQPSPDQRVA